MGVALAAERAARPGGRNAGVHRGQGDRGAGRSRGEPHGGGEGLPARGKDGCPLPGASRILRRRPADRAARGGTGGIDASGLLG